MKAQLALYSSLWILEVAGLLLEEILLRQSRGDALDFAAQWTSIGAFDPLAARRQALPV
jgi:hypothetical protein